MPISTDEQQVQTIDIVREVDIAAPIELTFESILEEIGPGSELPDGSSFQMKVEPWPGGRWFRDLGNSTGHLWGHVQVIKPPKLLEICGPLFMSYPAISHVSYRLTDEGGSTRLTIAHRAMGLITAEHREGVSEGWEYELTKIRQAAERKTGASNNGR